MRANGFAHGYREELAGLLVEFITEESQIPWSWETKNCGLWVSDWVERLTGVDPAAWLRGSATTAEGWQDFIKREGGFMPLVGWMMDSAGFARTGSPDIGDVGIVSAPIAISDRLPVVGTICAIRGNATWVARGITGIHYQNFPLVTAWDVTCRTRS